MAGRGRAPKEPDERKNPRNKPTHEWQNAPGEGWQHGKTPEAPDGLMAASVTAWKTWMGAWFAAYWKPEDLPGLRTLVRLYDQVERGEFHRAGELRLQMDTYGITPKGQQDRRWKPPAETTEVSTGPTRKSQYGHLRSVAGGC